MLRPGFTSDHVSPASSDLNRPPFSFSASAYTRLEFAPLTATPMRPINPFGNPTLCVISVHVSPPSTDLKSPEPGPPLDIVYSLRKASQSAAYMTIGCVRSMLTLIAAVLSSSDGTLVHVPAPADVL